MKKWYKELVADAVSQIKTYSTADAIERFGDDDVVFVDGRNLRNDALEGALTNARTDADVIASPTDVEVHAVKSDETSGGGVSPVFIEAAREGDTVFDPGPVTVTAHVIVTYAAN